MWLDHNCSLKLEKRKSLKIEIGTDVMENRLQNRKNNFNGIKVNIKIHIFMILLRVIKRNAFSVVS